MTTPSDWPFPPLNLPETLPTVAQVCLLSDFLLCFAFHKKNDRNRPLFRWEKSFSVASWHQWLFIVAFPPLLACGRQRPITFARNALSVFTDTSSQLYLWFFLYQNGLVKKSALLRAPFAIFPPSRMLPFQQQPTSSFISSMHLV
jgi:hypothetical protein